MKVSVPRVQRGAGHAAVALAASEAALLVRGATHTVPAPMLVDQMEEDDWVATLSALKKAAGVTRLHAVIALPSHATPLRFYRERPDSDRWIQDAASELLPDTEVLTLSGGARNGPWWVCAAPRETLLRLLSACRTAGVTPDAVEPAAFALLRLAPATSHTVAVAAAAPTGCEIAAGTAGVPILSRSVAAKRVEDVAAEIELTVRYLEREGHQDVRLTVAGPAAEAVAEILRTRGVDPAAVLPASSAAEVVALGAARRPRRAPDFLQALRGRRFGAPQAAAVAAMVALAVSVTHASAERSRADNLRSQVVALRAEQETLQAQLSRWTGPRAQAARQALQLLDARRVPVAVLDQLRGLVPADLWVERIEARGPSLRVEGRSLSRDSVLRFADAARDVWDSVVLKLAERDDVPATAYKFTVEATARRGTQTPPPAAPGPTAPEAPNGGHP